MQPYDDRLTFLLPRPVWVNDLDVAYCSLCNHAFGPLKRRPELTIEGDSGNIFCHDCSTRKVPLPQLGYGTKPVRVCNGCFDVAYLVTYAIDEDHGLTTQIHGVRGLLELTEKDDEKDLHNMVAYGGVDALIWLCRSSKSIKLHHLTTTILAMLAEKESIRPVIITKWALPPLLFLVRSYTHVEPIGTSSNHKKSPVNSIHSNTMTPSLTSDPSSSSATADDATVNNPVESRQSIILEIAINCTHILYQLSRAGILSLKEVIADGVFDTLLILASFDIQHLHLEKGICSDEVPVTGDDEQQVMERVLIIQSLAAKAISAISSLVSFQADIIELIQKTDRLSTLLRSPNGEVRKYIAKTVAYLSLRNDKYKPALLFDDGSKALVSILAALPQKIQGSINKKTRMNDLGYYLVAADVNKYDGNGGKEGEQDGKAQVQSINSAAVSHACCALANFATNNESQINLMSQPHLLEYICNVCHVFPQHVEIHRHVARCLANLALYEENNEAMLTNNKKSGEKKNKDCFNVLPTLLLIGKGSKMGVQRHIVRAIDNLSNNMRIDPPADHWHEIFGDAYIYINQILQKQQVEGEDNTVDVDTIKRAKSIIAREKAENGTADVVATIDDAAPSAETTEVDKDSSTSKVTKAESYEEENPKSTSSPAQEDAPITTTTPTPPNEDEDEEQEQEDIDGSNETIKKAPKSNSKSNKRRSKKNK
ncbi:hypothetical protein MAM1_0641c11069 [Mucor ambiguus]|uniref:FYVE zinc finger domain-containing protein n=1 Tax=Mucor ambiguus TaxID=91626 RepID=A0A0C9ML26_9FUNG|nr:hypothetical protein MAM1_0641c11069 [Mucor ambiguus]